MNREQIIADKAAFNSHEYRKELAIDKYTDGFCQCCGERLITWQTFPETQFEPAEYDSNCEREDGFCDSCGENWDNARRRVGYPEAGLYDEIDGWYSLDVDTPNGESVFIDTSEIMGLRPYQEATGTMIDGKLIPDGGHREVK